MKEAMKTTAMLFVAVLLCMAGPGQAARDLLQGTCNPKVIRETQNSELRQTFQLTDGRGWFIELCAGPTVNVDSGRLQVIISNSMATTMKYGCGSSTYSYSLTMRDHYLFQDAKMVIGDDTYVLVIATNDFYMESDKQIASGLGESYSISKNFEMANIHAKLVGKGPANNKEVTMNIKCQYMRNYSFDSLTGKSSFDEKMHCDALPLFVEICA